MVHFNTAPKLLKTQLLSNPIQALLPLPPPFTNSIQARYFRSDSPSLTKYKRYFHFYSPSLTQRKRYFHSHSPSLTQRKRYFHSHSSSLTQRKRYFHSHSPSLTQRKFILCQLTRLEIGLRLGYP